MRRVAYNHQETMDNALQGQLTEGALPNLLQYLTLNQSTGCLIVRRSKDLQGYVFFDKGKITHITLGDLYDLKALTELLSWSEGRFHFRSDVPSPRQSLDMTLETLLLEAAYHADSLELQGREAFTAETVLISSVSLENNVKFALSHGAIQLLRRLDGFDSLGQIARGINMSLHEVISEAENLADQLIVKPVALPIVRPELINELTEIIVNIMGPMGEIVVEDTLYDLDLRPDEVPRSIMADLLEALKLQLRRVDWQQIFLKKAKALCKRYGVNV